MSTTIKSNLNSSTNGCSLSALKKHITTCLLRWRQKYLKTQEQYKGKYQYQRLVNQKENCSCKLQQSNKKSFLKYSCAECSFVKSTTTSKSLNKKVFSAINSQQHLNKESSTIRKDDSEGPRRYGRKVEIVAKLLSSTLIAKTKSSTSVTEEREHIFEKTLKVIQNSTSTTTTTDFYEQNMTITDLTFMELREEYPEINSEIRSILTARAQEGATISQIREDYRKLTGLTFPIYEDVTEFLLTIPFVTAYCNEKGTRIFNIMPTEKTKHIHEMVVNQKTQPEPLQRPSSNNYYRERERNSNYQPLNWRQHTNRRLLENNANYEETPLNAKNVENQEHQIPTVETNLSRDYGSEVFYENNCFYQDNCNYLFNRICNQKPPVVSPTSQIIEKCPQILVKPDIMPPANTQTTDLNNFDADIPSYKNNINHLNNLLQVPQPQNHIQPYQHNLNNLRNTQARNSSLHPYKHKTALPASSRSSSPTVKSWYTNESAFTESDYEAHLLDFLLLGDDFFLYMARMELRCKFKKNQRILQSGLCVSGQTIGAAIKRLKLSNDQRRSIIVNIGSVDIMQGRQLIQIEHDFRELILTMMKKGIKPILTTLAPLANYSHNYEVKRVLERFNAFIKREGSQRNLIVIDIWKCLVNEKGHVMFDCYQNEPRNVTGTSESYLFWNKIGRQRVLQLIESNLEY